MYYGCRLAQDACGGEPRGREGSFSPCFRWLPLPLPLLHIFLRLISVVRQFVQTHFVVRLFHCDYLRLYNRSLTIIIIIVIIIRALALLLSLSILTFYVLRFFFMGCPKVKFYELSFSPCVCCVFPFISALLFFSMCRSLCFIVYIYIIILYGICRMKWSKL